MLLIEYYIDDLSIPNTNHIIKTLRTKKATQLNDTDLSYYFLLNPR